MNRRSVVLVLIVASVCCLTMALVDGVICPGYMVKSAIKIALFMIVAKRSASPPVKKTKRPGFSLSQALI